jgi:hypothetical protein
LRGPCTYSQGALTRHGWHGWHAMGCRQQDMTRSEKPGYKERLESLCSFSLYKSVPTIVAPKSFKLGHACSSCFRLASAAPCEARYSSRKLFPGSTLYPPRVHKGKILHTQTRRRKKSKKRAMDRIRAGVFYYCPVCGQPSASTIPQSECLTCAAYVLKSPLPLALIHVQVSGITYRVTSGFCNRVTKSKVCCRQEQVRRFRDVAATHPALANLDSNDVVFIVIRRRRRSD